MLRFIDDPDFEVEDLSGFRLVSTRSSLSAVVPFGDPATLAWSVHLEWIDVGQEEPSFRKAWAEIEGLDFGDCGWRNLAGAEARAEYLESEVHPIMPGNPGNVLLFGEHHFPNHNHVRVVARDGLNFTIHWTCRIEAGGPPGDPLEVVEAVRLSTVSVYFDERTRPSLAQAQAVVASQPGLSGLTPGEPSLSGAWVRFPVLASSEG